MSILVIFGLLMVSVVSIVLHSWVPIVALICLPLLGMIVAAVASAFVTHNTIVLVNQSKSEPYIYVDPEKVDRKELN